MSLWIFSRRAFERNSNTDSAGVSSMKSGADESGFVADSKWRHCSGVSRPDFTSLPARPVSAMMRRIINCTADISSEKNATPCSWSTAMLRAIERTNAVLPIDGRAAMMMRSESCHPSVTRSMDMNPDGTPLNALAFFDASSICISARARMSFDDCTERLTWPSETLKISPSANPISSVTSVDSS